MIKNVENNSKKLDSISQLFTLNHKQFQISNLTFHTLSNESENLAQLSLQKEQTIKSDIDKTNEEINIEIQEIESISNSNKTYNYEIENEAIYSHLKRLDLILPTVLVFIIMFNGILLSTLFASSDINSKGHKREMIINKNHYMFSAGYIFSLFFILISQLLFIILILNFFSELKLLFYFPSLIIIVIILLLIFILLGLIIAHNSLSSYVALLTSTFAILLLIILSDILLPLQLLNENIIYLIDNNPLVLSKQLIEFILFSEVAIFYHNNILYLILILIIEIIIYLLSIRFNFRITK